MDSHVILSLVHVFAVAPLLVIIAKTQWIPPLVVAAIGAIITLYHAWKTYTKLAAGRSAWINIVHAAVIGPALVVKGLVPDAPRAVSELILMFAFAAAGYHAYYLLTPLVRAST